MKVIGPLIFLVSTFLCKAEQPLTLVCDEISAEKMEKVVLIGEGGKVATAKEARFEEGKNHTVRLVLKDYVRHTNDDVVLMGESDSLLEGEVIVLTAGRSRKLQLSGWQWVKDKGVLVRMAKYRDGPEAKLLPFDAESVLLSEFLACAGE